MPLERRLIVVPSGHEKKLLSDMPKAITYSDTYVNCLKKRYLLEGLKKKEYTMILISALPPILLPYKPVKFTNTISLFNGYFINLVYLIKRED
jgi:hypothetical protein